MHRIPGKERMIKLEEHLGRMKYKGVGEGRKNLERIPLQERLEEFRKRREREKRLTGGSGRGWHSSDEEEEDDDDDYSMGSESESEDDGYDSDHDPISLDNVRSDGIPLDELNRILNIYDPFSFFDLRKSEFIDEKTVREMLMNPTLPPKVQQDRQILYNKYLRRKDTWDALRMSKYDTIKSRLAELIELEIPEYEPRQLAEEFARRELQDPAYHYFNRYQILIYYGNENEKRRFNFKTEIYLLSRRMQRGERCIDQLRILLKNELQFRLVCMGVNCRACDYITSCIGTFDTKDELYNSYSFYQGLTRLFHNHEIIESICSMMNIIMLNIVRHPDIQWGEIKRKANESRIIFEEE